MNVRAVPVPPGTRPRELAHSIATRENAQLVAGWSAALTALAAEAATRALDPGGDPQPPVPTEVAIELRRAAHDAQRTSVLVATIASSMVALRRSLADLPAIDADPHTIHDQAKAVSLARRRAETAASLAGELDVDPDALVEAAKADKALVSVDRRHAFVGQAARGLAVAAVGLALMAVGSRSVSAAVAIAIVVVAVAAGAGWWIRSRRRVAEVERRAREAMASVGATSWDGLDELIARREEWEARFAEALEAHEQVRSAMATWHEVAGDLDPAEAEAVAMLALERAAAQEALDVLETAAIVAAARLQRFEHTWCRALAGVGLDRVPPSTVDQVLATLPSAGMVIVAAEATGGRADAVRGVLEQWEGRPVWVVVPGVEDWGLEPAEMAL